jgi:PHD and RING finger domain-containing protein 1
MKRASCRRRSEENGDKSDNTFEQHGKREKRISVSEKTEGCSGDVHVTAHPLRAASTTVQTERMSEEAGTSSRQLCAASTAPVCGSVSPSTSPEAVLPAAYMSDSSSDGDSEKCAICLVTLGAQEVGTPDTCNHFFCASCLEEWSANASTCPLDRQEFNFILCRHYPEGQIIRRIPLRPQRRENEYEDLFLQNIIFCTLCDESDREDTLIYCYVCGFLYHPECIGSLPEVIYLQDWSCPLCAVINSVFEID